MADTLTEGDTVYGCRMCEKATEGKTSRVMHGRVVCLYVKIGDDEWRWVATFHDRREAYRYWQSIKDGKTYRLGSANATMTPTAIGL